MNQKPGACLLRVVLGFVVIGVLRVSSRADTQPTATDDQNYIVYQLRAGEDPSKVARMFHVTLEALLGLNQISDPHRLGVGATLKIPDPRATLVAELRTEKEGLQRQLAAAQGSVNELQTTVRGLESKLSDVRDTNETLQTQLVLYHTWRLGVIVAAATAGTLAVALLFALGKVHEGDRRRRLATKEIEILRTAVDKYRQLSAHFELRYQSIFHRVRLPAGKQARGQALRQRMDEDRARLDAIVAEAERDLKRATAALIPEPGPKPARGLLMWLSAARKNS